MDIDAILKTAIDLGASDIHLVSGQPPIVRVHTLMASLEYPIVTSESAMRMV